MSCFPGRIIPGTGGRHGPGRSVIFHRFFRSNAGIPDAIVVSQLSGQ